MIPVSEALERLFALVGPMPVETVPLRAAAGRWMAEAVTATRTQPPFDASAMDGYALKAIEADRDAQLKVIGEAAAGHGFSGKVGAGQCVRIFTGAPMPEGTDAVVIQEDITRAGDVISLTGAQFSVGHVRPAGGDFRTGDQFAPDRALSPADIALLAAMNIAEVPVYRRPEIAIIATGDELVMPGETPGADQIIASNSFGLAALLEARGALPRLLPIARDTPESLREVFRLAQGADLIVTIGGASVGDHDLVGDVAETMGLERDFYKIAMRPGKPLMAGRMRDAVMVGLPGNPVSAMVCGAIFLCPMIDVMLGRPAAPAPRQHAPLAKAVAANGPREHYMRAVLGPDGLEIAERQDSSLLSILAGANALVVRPPHDPAREVGEEVAYIPL